MSKEDEEKKAAKKIQDDVALEAARADAPWINYTRLAITDGGMIRLSFLELDSPTKKVCVRKAVTMSPTTAAMLVELINRFVDKVETTVKKEMTH